MNVEDICKIVPCAFCCGKGKLERYPHYANPMPDLIIENCEYCQGRGKVVLVASGVQVVRDSSFHI